MYLTQKRVNTKWLDKKFSHEKKKINRTKENIVVYLWIELFYTLSIQISQQNKLDVDPQRDDDASPMST